MSGDYLWDRSGKPDPETEKLEHVLGRLRYDRPAPEFPETLRAVGLLARVGFSPRWFFPSLAAAFATVLIVLGLAWVSRSKAPVGEGWNVTFVAGTPRVGMASPGTSEGTGRLGVGQTLETDGQSRARIRFEDIGEIRIDPDTRLRVLTSPTGASRLALDRGTIHARIWASPGNFVVDTPSARAVDLGCAYTLHVDASGDGLIRTSLGWVGFKLGDHESFIPAGAACVTRTKSGPGTPYFEDSSEAFRAALSMLDLASGTEADRSAALRRVLAQSRKRDALTLWHLLSRTEDSDRGLVFDRLAKLVAPPSGVTREGILHLDHSMLDSWWSQLDLGDISLWRHWERSWTQRDQQQQKSP
jgi:hypothetical protein